jgi:hypothetical protein
MGSESLLGRLKLKRSKLEYLFMDLKYTVNEAVAECIQWISLWVPRRLSAVYHNRVTLNHNKD